MYLVSSSHESSHSCSLGRQGCVKLDENYQHGNNLFIGCLQRCAGRLLIPITQYTATHVAHVNCETALLKTVECAAVWNNGTFNEHTQSMELSTWVALLPPTILSQVTFTCWTPCVTVCEQYLKAFMSKVSAICSPLHTGESVRRDALQVVAAMHALLITT